MSFSISTNSEKLEKYRIKCHAIYWLGHLMSLKTGRNWISFCSWLIWLRLKITFLLSFPELINLLIAAQHPVIDIKHVSLNNELDIFRALIKSCSSLQLFGLRFIKIIKFFSFVLVCHSYLLIKIVNLLLYQIQIPF